MSALGKRTTIYLDTELHRALKLKAIEKSESISALINKAVRDSIIEDEAYEDNQTFAARVNEELISYDALISKLKKDGYI